MMRLRTLALLWMVLCGIQQWIALRHSAWGVCLVGLDYSMQANWWYVHQPEITIHELLMLSMLVLMPLGAVLASGTERKRSRVLVETGAAVCAAFSLMMRPGLPLPEWGGTPSAALALPWLALRIVDASQAFSTSRLSGIDGWCLRLARVFPAIGAAWLVAHRAGIAPWRFDPLIVLLTAAHFHHAGFTLPLMAGLNAKARPGCWTRFSCVAILLGVPLVAIGITCMHFGVLPFVEPFGVTVLVLGALGVAVSQIQRGLEKERDALAQLGFVVSGVSLLAAMLLALGFGLRYLIPNLALTMPQMWAVHGTLNAFGFGLCGILAWRGATR